jgi:hypothetical protein
MDNTVLAFLTNKVANILAQTLIAHLILKISHRLDKKPLPLGEMYRQGVKEPGQNRITSIPVTGHCGCVKGNLAGTNRYCIHVDLLLLRWPDKRKAVCLQQFYWLGNQMSREA